MCVFKVPPNIAEISLQKPDKLRVKVHYLEVSNNRITVTGKHIIPN